MAGSQWASSGIEEARSQTFQAADLNFTTTKIIIDENKSNLVKSVVKRSIGKLNIVDHISDEPNCMVVEDDSPESTLAVTTDSSANVVIAPPTPELWINLDVAGNCKEGQRKMKKSNMEPVFA